MGVLCSVLISRAFTLVFLSCNAIDVILNMQLFFPFLIFPFFFGGGGGWNIGGEYLHESWKCNYEDEILRSASVNNEGTT